MIGSSMLNTNYMKYSTEEVSDSLQYRPETHFLSCFEVGMRMTMGLSAGYSGSGGVAINPHSWLAFAFRPQHYSSLLLLPIYGI